MRYSFLLMLICLTNFSEGQQKQWPVLKHYEGKYIEKIAMPVGGIGTGNISIAVIRYEIKNKTSDVLTVAVAGSLDNFIGMDGSKAEFNSFDRSLNLLGTKSNRNTFKQTNTLAGIYMTSDSVDHDSNAWGTI